MGVEGIKNESYIINSVFKELLRFKNVNKMLSDKNRRENLNNFFEYVKKTIYWMQKNPHFWLQYGMANLFLRNFDRAKQYFDNAYGSAVNDPNYDTTPI